MLRYVKKITGYRLQAFDDEIGAVKDFLFDDQQWVVRYLLADTHKWLPGGRKVLISPISVGQPDVDERVVPVKLSCAQIKASPPLESDLPVSRQYEKNLFRYYGYGYYWMGPYPWGMYPSPVELDNRDLVSDEDGAKENNDPNLRSANEVSGYYVHAKGVRVGHVTDFVFDDKQWKIVFLVINTRNWWPGGRDLLISPEHIVSVDWRNRSVYTDLTAEQIKSGTEFDGEVFSEADHDKVFHVNHAL